MPYTGMEGYQMLQNSMAQLGNAFAQRREAERQEELFAFQKKKLALAEEEARRQREALDEGMGGLQRAFTQQITPEQEAMGPPTAAGAMPTAGYSEQDRQAELLQAGLNLYRGGNEALGNRIANQVLYPDPTESQESQLSKLLKTRADTELVNQKILGERIANEQAKINLAGSADFFGAKGAIVNMLDSQAEATKSAKERTDLKRMSLMVKAAADGKGMTDVLEAQFPNVKGASTAFEALLRNGADPIQAYKTVKQIDTQNALSLKKEGKTASRDFGHDREALASIIYDGKAFAELKPQEQKLVNDQYLTQRVSEQQQKVADLPLSAGNQDKVATYNYLLELAQKAMSLATPELVGELNAPLEQIKQRLGQGNPQFTQLSNTLDELVDAVARDRTGAVIGADEQKFYGSLLGSVKTNPKTLIERLTGFVERTEGRRNSVLELATTSAADIRKQYTTPAQRRTSPAQTAPAPAPAQQVPTPAPAPAPQAVQPTPAPQPDIPPVKPSGRTSTPPTPEQLQKGRDILKGLGLYR